MAKSIEYSFSCSYTLDPLYSDQFPMVAKKLNIPFILHLHINHPQNEAMISELVSATQAMGYVSEVQSPYFYSSICRIPYFRLLKLLFIKIFNPLLYDDLERVATGAYGTVYKTKLIHKEDTEIAVKLMAVPKSIHDRYPPPFILSPPPPFSSHITQMRAA